LAGLISATAAKQILRSRKIRNPHHRHEQVHKLKGLNDAALHYQAENLEGFASDFVVPTWTEMGQLAARLRMPEILVTLAQLGKKHLHVFFIACMTKSRGIRSRATGC
jgi:hypothetical protein